MAFTLASGSQITAFRRLTYRHQRLASTPFPFPVQFSRSSFVKLLGVCVSHPPAFAPLRQAQPFFFLGLPGPAPPKFDTEAEAEVEGFI